jgi:ferredoxin
MTITPSKCIQCRLCEDSCPYGAIDIPQINPNPEDRGTTRRKLILVSFMIPVFIFLGGFTVSQLHETLAGVNSTVRLAKLLLDPAPPVGQAETFEMTAFRSSGKPVADVFAEASAIRRQFYIGSWILGSFLGLAFGSTLAGRMLRGYNPDYTPNRGACYSCARCMDFCPVDRKNELTNV